MRASGYAVLAAMLAATPLAAQQDSTWRDHDRAARDARVRGDWAASRGHVDEWRPLYVSRFLAPGTWRRTEWTDSCFNVDRLIGAQNGVTPNRVVAFDLDATHSRIVEARTLARDTTRIREPTHLVAVGDDIFYVANGGFGLYDERGTLRPGVTQVAPVIARLSMRLSRAHYSTH